MADAWQLAAGSTPLSLLYPQDAFTFLPLISFLSFSPSSSSSSFPLFSFFFHSLIFFPLPSLTSSCSTLSFPTLLFEVPFLALILLISDFQIC